ncbi:hypothetical protein KLP40_00840 [Hymenobacter sp. NST-14]|uniref:hypothetical protein n=1 Tax=Hymenobacter piscis TaxID=2839984 RepID=UPI001C033BE4|nr:hypothetical protein [Hymenobacter piscis]MBT9391692.1 hypothetical protein [Hymenobacter piscis]
MYNDLNEPQKELCDLMSSISEEAWCAGWMEGLEYALWHIVNHGPAQYGRRLISEEIIQQLKKLSQNAQSWIIFDDLTEETAVPILEWHQMFQLANPN